MTVEEVKNFLAANDDILSYREISRQTGYSVAELREMYDSIFYNKELRKRKTSFNHFRRKNGAYRIDPITYELTYYKDLSEIAKDGFTPSNVSNACKNTSCICSGYLWRFATDINPENVEESLKVRNPELFTPLKATDKKGNVKRFKNIFYALQEGYNKKDIHKALNGDSKFYRKLKWEEDETEQTEV